MQTCSEPTCATPQQPLAQQCRGPRIRGRSMRSAPLRDPNSLSPPGRQPRCVRTPHPRPADLSTTRAHLPRAAPFLASLGPLVSTPQAHCPATQGRALSFSRAATEGPPLHAVTPLTSGPWPTRQTPARHLPSRSRPRVRDHAAWLVRSASPAHDQHPCAAVISVITFRVPLSLYKPRHRQSPFPST